MAKIIVAAGLVILEDDKVLLNQHGDPAFWKFCGGKVEDSDKDLIETACREAKEEMGIDIEIINPEPFLVYTKKETMNGDCDVILIHYLAKRIGEIKPDAGIRQWDWLPLKGIENQDLAPNILLALKHFNFI